jgi:hypothetical protein
MNIERHQISPVNYDRIGPPWIRPVVVNRVGAGSPMRNFHSRRACRSIIRPRRMTG